MWIQSLALITGSRIQCCQRSVYISMQLGSSIAVAVVQASSCSSNLTPSLELPYATKVALKKKKKKKTKRLRNKRKPPGREIPGSLVVRTWHFSPLQPRIQSLVYELRSHIKLLYVMAKTNKKPPGGYMVSGLTHRSLEFATPS